LATRRIPTSKQRYNCEKAGGAKVWKGGERPCIVKISAEVTVYCGGEKGTGHGGEVLLWRQGMWATLGLGGRSLRDSRHGEEKRMNGVEAEDRECAVKMLRGYYEGGQRIGDTGKESSSTRPGGYRKVGRNN